MPALDSGAVDHLDSGAPTKPVFLIYLDIDGDPIRATTVSYPVTLPTLTDPDLSEQTFYPTVGVVDVGTVQHSEQGSETLPVELSGLLLPDAALLAAIGDRTKWQGRPCRLWVIIRNEARVQQGAVASYYSGYMSSVTIVPGAASQTIKLEVEGYKALLNSASYRSYLDQKRYDAADTSATATIGSANGATAGGSDIGGDFSVTGRQFTPREYIS